MNSNKFLKKNYKFCTKTCKTKFFSNIAKIEKKTTKQKLKQLLTESRQNQGKCANCDEDNIKLFEFAHFNRNDKLLSVSQHQCLRDVKKELLKGRWLCVWCHRQETLDENKLIFGKMSKRQSSKSYEYIKNIKMKIGGCILCNKSITKDTISFFEFDHIDKTTKYKNISNLVGFKKETVDFEIAKCRLLCCICHRLHTIIQSQTS